MKKGERRMDDRERKPDNRNNKKRNYQLYIILAIVAAVTVALITGLDSLVKKSTTKKVTYDEFVEAVEEGKVDLALTNDTSLIGSDAFFITDTMHTEVLWSVFMQK